MLLTRTVGEFMEQKNFSGIASVLSIRSSAETAESENETINISDLEPKSHAQLQENSVMTVSGG